MHQAARLKILSLFTCFILTVPQVVAAAEQTSKEMWETLLINWFPMLLLIGVWIYFILDLLHEEYEKVAWKVAILGWR